MVLGSIMDEKMKNLVIAFTLIGVSLFIMACQGESGQRGPRGYVGPPGFTYPDYYHRFAPEVRPIVREFEDHAIQYGSRHSAKSIHRIDLVEGEIKSYNPDGSFRWDVIGKCQRFKSGRRHILLEQETWHTKSQGQLRLLVYHEMGHCLMNLRHTDVVDKRGCPHIMNPKLPSNATIAKCWGTLLDTLFQSPKTTELM